MNLGTAFAIGATLLSTFGGGGSGQSASTSGGGETGDALGFIKKGLGVYNRMRTGAEPGPQPFATDIAFKDTGSYYKKFGAGKSTSVSTPQFTPYRVQNADVNTAIVNLYNNAQNQQMKQLLAQYSGAVPFTLRQGRKTQALEQSSLGTISV